MYQVGNTGYPLLEYRGYLRAPKPGTAWYRKLEGVRTELTRAGWIGAGAAVSADALLLIGMDVLGQEILRHPPQAGAANVADRRVFHDKLLRLWPLG